MAARVEAISRDRGNGKKAPPSPPEFKGRAYSTPTEDDLEIAVLRFASDWLSDYRLGDRRPNEIEVFLNMADGQILALTLRGEKMIDAVLDGDAGPLRKQLLRTGLPPGALIPAGDGGPLESVELASSRFFPLRVQEYEERRQLLAQGVAFRDLPDRLRKRAKRVSRAYVVGTEFFHTSKAAQAESKRTGRPVTVLDMRNGPVVDTFLKSKLGQSLAPISVTSVAPGKPKRQQAAAAVKEARKRKRPVRLQVEVEGRPLQVKVPTGKVGRVRRPSGVSVQVVRTSKGRFDSAFDAESQAAIYRLAKEQGFSKVARDLGIARTTIYGWAPKP